jgi:hypothetical protein
MAGDQKQQKYPVVKIDGSDSDNYSQFGIELIPVPKIKQRRENENLHILRKELLNENCGRIEILDEPEETAPESRQEIFASPDTNAIDDTVKKDFLFASKNKVEVLENGPIKEDEPEETAPESRQEIFGSPDTNAIDDTMKKDFLSASKNKVEVLENGPVKEDDLQ